MADSWPEVEGFPKREDVPGGRKLNLGCGAMILPRDDGWVNADRNAAPGVDVMWDCWTLPWPVASEVFEYVLMCHLAEHIPHEVHLLAPDHRATAAALEEQSRRFGHWATAHHRYKRTRAQDEGWFAVFGEVHRILRPGGRVYIVSPYGLSDGAMQDPTHTRFLVPRTFAYFEDQPTPDYQLGYSWRLLNIDLTADPDTLDLEMQGMEPEDVRRLMAREFNIARTMRVIMERV